MPTVALSTMRGRAIALKPPRVLLTGFDRGQTVGPPGDTATQLAVLTAALRLLEQHDTTVLETYVKA